MTNGAMILKVTFDIARSGLFKGPLNNSIAGLAAAADAAEGKFGESERSAVTLSAIKRGDDCMANAAWA
jgi:hypothetical protein